MIKNSNSEHWLIEQAELSNTNIAVRSHEFALSYNGLLKLVKKSVKFFLKKGIVKNNHVAVISENNPEFVLTIHALWFIGAIPIPINPKLNKNELIKLIQISDANIIINIQSVLDYTIKERISQFAFRIDQINEYETDVDIVNYEPSNICLMMFTSGSTGSPKCVQLTFGNLFESFRSADIEIKHTASDLWLASLPFYHIGGFSIITRSIFAGCSLVLPK